MRQRNQCSTSIPPVEADIIFGSFHIMVLILFNYVFMIRFEFRDGVLSRAYQNDGKSIRRTGSSSKQE